MAEGVGFELQAGPDTESAGGKGHVHNGCTKRVQIGR